MLLKEFQMWLFVELSTVEAGPGVSVETTAWVDDDSPSALIFTEKKNQNFRTKRLKYRKETTPTCSAERKKQGKWRMVEDLPTKAGEHSRAESSSQNSTYLLAMRISCDFVET